MTAKENSVTYKDRGRKRLVAAVEAMAGLQVTVGVQGASALKPAKIRKARGGHGRKKSKRATRLEASRIRMVDLAAIHEFGAPIVNIPERSFIRSTFADQSKIRRVTRAALKDVIKGRDPVAVANRAGMRLEAAVKKTLTDLRDPPLAPSTIERRYRLTGDADPNPLVDTGQLRSSISYQVRFKGSRVSGSDR